MELFEFYVDSAEWFEGGLERAAAILERLGPDHGGPGPRAGSWRSRESHTAAREGL
jgi:hypothetical protein